MSFWLAIIACYTSVHLTSRVGVQSAVNLTRISVFLKTLRFKPDKAIELWRAVNPGKYDDECASLIEELPAGFYEIENKASRARSKKLALLQKLANSI